MSDSPAVLALKAKLAQPHFNDGSYWAKDWRKRIHKQIRNQRLKEARERGTHTVDEWAAIVAEFGSRCVVCGCEPVGGPCKDHILPIHMGGSDAADNLQPVCRECNTAKRADSTNWAAYRRVHGFED